MTSRTFFAHAVRHVLTTGVAAVLVTAGGMPALAQQQSGGAVAMEEVLVTGSRIKGVTNEESSSPITVVTAEEIALLNHVEVVMDEATGILERPDTGSQAIGAETEAIELLLKSKKINPKGGGGGGSSPGGGGSGTTNDTAIALVGSGVNDKEVREDRGVAQATGESGASLPEEFRAGLDEYFNRLERDAGK